MSVNFNPDKKKGILAKITSSAVKATQKTNGTQESCFSNNGLSSNKIDLSQFENSSEWTPVQAKKNSKFLFFGNNGYTFRTSCGVEILIENPDDLGEAQIFENKETGEVFVINARGAKIKSDEDNTSISIYNSQIDSIETKKGDDTINVYDSTIDELNTGKGSDEVSIYNSLIESLETGAGSDIINIDDSSIDNLKSQKDFLWGLFGSSNDTINIENSDIETLETGHGNDTVISNDSDIETLRTVGGVNSVSLNNTQTTTSDLDENDLKIENGNYLADFDISKIPAVETSEVITLQSGEQINIGDYLALIPQQQVGFETEAEYQQYTIQAISDNLESMRAIFQAQNDKDGIMADGFSSLKELTGLGISSDDVENVIAEQEEIINQLTLAMNGQSDLSFEEAYEKYTGTKFSTEKIDKYMELSNIASMINSGAYYDKDFADKFEEATGKSIDEINQEFALCQNEVLGKSQALQNLVEEYSLSQEGFADKLSAIISTTGMVCIVAGAIVSFIPGGAAIGVPLMTTGKYVAFGGMLADNAIDLVDHSTDKDGLTSDEVKNLALETGVELVSYGTGRVIGAGTNALNSFIAKEATKRGIGTIGSYILGQAAETVADTTLSLGADYLITQGQSLITTGEFMDASDYWSADRFLGEGKNQLIGILTGLSSSKVDAYSQSIIATAQGKIQAGDIDGARKYLEDSGIKVDNSSFSKLIDSTLAQKINLQGEDTNGEAKVSENKDSESVAEVKPAVNDEVSPVESLAAGSINGLFKMNLQLFGESSKNNSLKPNEKITGNQEYKITGNEIFDIQGYELDLSNPHIQEKLSKMQEGEVITVGRSPDSTIQITNSNVSRQHLVIQKTSDGYVLKDISKNGTVFLGLGKNVSVEQPKLKPNEKITGNQEYKITGNEIFDIQGYELDLSNPHIQEKLSKMQEGEVITVGRSPDSTIQITNSNVSRQHLVIQKTSDGYVLKDISKNGTVFLGLGKNVSVEQPVKIKLESNFKGLNAELAKKIEQINDPTIIKYINAKFPSGKLTAKQTRELEMIADAINTYNKNYRITKSAENWLYIDSNGNDAVRRLLKQSDDERGMITQLINEDSQLYISPYAKDVLDEADISVRAFIEDVKLEEKFYAAKKYIQNYQDSPIANHLYDLFIETLRQRGTSTTIISKLQEINDNYNVKVFPTGNFKDLSRKDTFTEEYQTLEALSKELNAWKKASDGQAKLPPTVDFTSVDRSYLPKGNHLTGGASGGHSHSKTHGAISINGMDVHSLMHAIRHEIMHTNDLSGNNVKIRNNSEMAQKLLKILLNKNINPKTITSLESLPYYSEFVRAGHSRYQIKYAYSNPAEFIAVASEKNIRSYSKEFINILIDLGMPSWAIYLQ